MQNLLPVFSKVTPPDFFAGKLETFLTCRKVAEYLREKILDEDIGKILEEKALKGVNESLHQNVSFADLRLLFSELPKLLPLDYPVAKEIHKDCIKVISQMKDIWWLQLKSMNKLEVCKNWAELNYILEMLKVLD